MFKEIIWNLPQKDGLCSTRLLKKHVVEINEAFLSKILSNIVSTDQDEWGISGDASNDFLEPKETFL